MIDQTMQQEFYQITGWTIIHFLWQGACVGALALLLLILWRPTSANRRYFVLCASFALLTLCPLVTMAWLSMQTVSSGYAKYGSLSRVESDHYSGNCP